MKYGRTYQMVVDGESQKWIVAYPFTCKFFMSATGTATANTAHFFFYNLPEKVRNDVLKDFNEDLEYRRLLFSAGYESQPQLPIIFVGNVFWAYSYRQGPDWITEIQAVDGGWGIEKGDINYIAPARTDLQTILKALMLKLPNVKFGVISNSINAPGDTRAVSISGNPWEELVKRILPLNAQLYISKETVYVVGQNDVVDNPGGLDEISDETGIIGSPRRQATLTVVTMIFEPRIEVGQKLVLKSSQPYAGDQKVFSVEHKGTISAAVGEDLTTTVTFLRIP